MLEELVTDVLVVGGGAAGLCAAIAARREDADTLLVSISSPGAGNATAVSGAIMNAALGADDSAELHLEDTLRSGVFLNDRHLIGRVVEMMPHWLPKLEEYGVGFAKSDAGYTLARSPGHTRARTLMFHPRVGTTLSRPLAETARRLGVKMLPNFNLAKILVHDGRSVGALGYLWETDEVVHVVAKAVVLATGGASLVYSRTRIPPGVPGDGYGIALDAGLTLQDMEFVQFYPTILSEPGWPKMLLGYEYFLRAGAVLRNSLGEDIVAKHCLPEPEMITRDQLSIAIGREIYEGKGVDGAILMDMSNFEPDIDSTLYGSSTFGRMVKERQAKGENLLARPIRLAPANHYYMGGIRAEANGATSVGGLLACGEVVGGTHGANRLQGNSLSETVALGFDTGRQAAAIASTTPAASVPKGAVDEFSRDLRAALGRQSGTPVREILKSLQSLMTGNAGLVREAKGLQEAKAAIGGLRAELPRAAANAPREKAQLCTLSALLDTAESIVVSALVRAESRGGHYRMDYPKRNDADWLRHVTCVKDGERIQASFCPVRE